MDFNGAAFSLFITFFIFALVAWGTFHFRGRKRNLLNNGFSAKGGITGIQ